MNEIANGEQELMNPVHIITKAEENIAGSAIRERKS